MIKTEPAYEIFLNIYKSPDPEDLDKYGDSTTSTPTTPVPEAVTMNTSTPPMIQPYHKMSSRKVTRVRNGPSTSSRSPDLTHLNNNIQHHNNNNNNNNNINNNLLKNERLSPATSEGRPGANSRSVTPSLATATPQQPETGSLNIFAATDNRIFGEYMKSLAAKYHNASPHDPFFHTNMGRPNGSGAGFIPTLLDARLRFAAAAYPSGGHFLPTSASSQHRLVVDTAEVTLPPLPLTSRKQPADLPPALSTGPSSNQHPQHQSTLHPVNNLCPAANQDEPGGIEMMESTCLMTMFKHENQRSLRTARHKRHRHMTSASVDPSSPLDLSTGAPFPSITSTSAVERRRHHHRIRRFMTQNLPYYKRSQSASPKQHTSSSNHHLQHNHQHEDISGWSVDDVCQFVGGIDICAEYVQVFRDQQIDGAGLPLLTEEHLTNRMNMKLGPVLKLRSILTKKLGSSCNMSYSQCSHCHNGNGAANSNSPERTSTPRTTPDSGSAS